MIQNQTWNMNYNNSICLRWYCVRCVTWKINVC